ncbi:MAG: phosphoribosylanthranilate isomerase [Pirellulales bacterium]|nr:phosphoribosylanthranilate isomerase [Pirellulales bacterium]
MFRVKICGITNVEDARMAVDAGADAIGLNFYAKSRRYVEPQLAAEIAHSISQNTTVVGLFVNSSVDEINAIRDRVPIDVVQLHGDESPELLRELDSNRILRALRFGTEGIRPLVDYLKRCEQLNCLPGAVLIDAYAEGAYGGTGQKLDWQRLARERRDLPDLPLILAGGLSPDNVAEAIRVVGPHGVDVSSGVETESNSQQNTRKNAAKVHAFVAAASGLQGASESNG